MTDFRAAALAAGFDEAAPIDPQTLVPRADVRDACAADRCRAYGRNWTCPPHCGTPDECAKRMKGYEHGLVLQTVGRLSKSIDTKGYAAAEQRHNDNLRRFAECIRAEHPGALCLGAGGCRVCDECAYPEPCRFPDKAMSSMEGYGLFVTEVCRNAGLEYYHGEKTITYTACVLY